MIRTENATEQMCDLHKNFVASGMTQGVVNFLEPVKIKEQYRACSASIAPVFNCVIDFAAK